MHDVSRPEEKDGNLGCKECRSIAGKVPVDRHINEETPAESGGGEVGQEAGSFDYVDPFLRETRLL